MKISKIIFWIMIGMVILIVIVNIILSIMTNVMCEKACIERGAIHYKRTPDGKWFSLNDECMCFYKNKIESLILFKK